jgi:hypothetical protein
VSGRPKESSTYLQRLLTELDGIRHPYVEVLSTSEIMYVNPNPAGSYVVFLGHPDWGWTASSWASCSIAQSSRRCGSSLWSTSMSLSGLAVPRATEPKTRGRAGSVPGAQLRESRRRS